MQRSMQVKFLKVIECVKYRHDYNFPVTSSTHHHELSKLSECCDRRHRNDDRCGATNGVGLLFYFLFHLLIMKIVINSIFIIIE